MKTRYYIGLALILSLVLAGGTLLIARQGVDARHDQLISGCKRNNPLRQGLYNNSIADARSREAAASQFTGEAHKTIKHLAAQNRRDAQALVDAAGDLSLSPGSPEINCEKAFK